MAALPVPAAPAAKPTALRVFGRFELRQLLGKSAATMAWLAFDPRAGQELMLTMPRAQPADGAALDHWLRDARAAARLNHPNLAPPVEIDVHDHWPYIAVERSLGLTLAEWLQAHPKPAPAEAVLLLCQALQGLAFAHEAGASHLDLQLHSIVVNDAGQVRVMALGAAAEAAARSRAPERGMPLDTGALRAQRSASERDLLAIGVLLHRLLSAAPVLDEPDIARVIERMPPLGRELVRLPWTTPHPVPEPLRAIANRATSAQERQRYLHARSLLRALTGWHEAQSQDTGGPLALLLDRIRSVGHLPAAPGAGARLSLLSSMEAQHTDELAEKVLHDMALSFELLRTVNSAQVQGTQVTGNGPVLTIHRALALIGMNGIRHAANALRPWPGPLNETGANALRRLMDRVRLAGLAAQALRPAGYDAEVVYLITLLQNLGRLMVQYHFGDEAEQIRQLMQPAPPPAGAEPGTPEQPGMSEEAAAFAVLGVDIESLGAAVVRGWGLGEEVQHMIRRLSTGHPVRSADTDADLLRCLSSAANEAIDALALPPARVAPAMALVAQRYARVLGISLRDLQEALQAARSALHSGAPAPALRTQPGNEPTDAPPTPATVAPAPSLRARAAQSSKA